MLLAHPAVLQNLVEQYETLHALHAEDGSAEARRRLEDVSYTLCVSTGTRAVEDALRTARERLTEAGLLDAGEPAAPRELTVTTVAPVTPAWAPTAPTSTRAPAAAPWPPTTAPVPWSTPSACCAS
ncbi:DUF5133 domain-containing protein, partial [Streptomyces fuscigenes]|uniref:DUF5133 domain-containing protein n=1 Tax=Streptomyces fuscigenes TaxID=1528880 RepID=UPI0035574627